MNEGRTVFSQLMDFLPLHRFRQCVERYGGNYKIQSFTCLDQFLCLAFAQLSYPYCNLPAGYPKSHTKPTSSEILRARNKCLPLAGIGEITLYISITAAPSGLEVFRSPTFAALPGTTPSLLLGLGENRWVAGLGSPSSLGMVIGDPGHAGLQPTAESTGDLVIDGISAMKRVEISYDGDWASR